MLVVNSLPVAILFCVLTMVGWGSWANTQKLAGKEKYNVTGTLTMHGVSKEVTLPVTFLGSMKDPRGNDVASFELQTKLNRKDFGINWNKTLDKGGLLVGNDVTLDIKLELNK